MGSRHDKPDRERKGQRHHKEDNSPTHGRHRSSDTRDVKKRRRKQGSRGDDFSDQVCKTVRSEEDNSSSASFHSGNKSRRKHGRRHRHDSDDDSSASHESIQSKRSEAKKKRKHERRSPRKSRSERSHKHRKKEKRHKRKSSRKHHYNKEGRVHHKRSHKEKAESQTKLPPPPRDLFPMGNLRGYPPEQELDVETNYFEYHAHLRLYLYRRDGTMFEDLTSEEAREQFKNFVKDYNKGNLEEGFYQDAGSIPQEAMNQCKRTKHSWNFNTSSLENQSLNILREGVKKQTENNEVDKK